VADDPAKDSTTDSQQDEALGERVSRLETGQDSLSGKIDQILGILGDGGAGQQQGHDENPSGAQPNIAHEIRAQLDERDRKKAADDTARADADRIGAVETRLAELAEKPPEPMPSRRERWMWGGR
jgi:hypothetical protein